jgi:hypothetical protein
MMIEQTLPKFMVKAQPSPAFGFLHSLLTVSMSFTTVTVSAPQRDDRIPLVGALLALDHVQSADQQDCHCRPHRESEASSLGSSMDERWLDRALLAGLVLGYDRHQRAGAVTVPSTKRATGLA